LSNCGQIKPARICFVVAVPFTANAFLSQHILALARKHSVSIALNGAAQDLRAELRQTPIHRFCIVRKIAPFRDLIALISLWNLFRRERFDVIHSMSPKAGLLASVAGFLAGVPVRIHWFTGQVWATKRGLMRILLKTMDKITSRCATDLLSDSHSQAKFLTTEKVTSAGKIQVLASGSTCGVDILRFHPDLETGNKIRATHGIPDEATIALFVGRMQPEKGIRELCAAFLAAAQSCPDLHLMLVGPDEAGMKKYIQAKLAEVSKNLHWIGLTDRPEEYMAASDFLVIPSYREGFGSVVIEAAACGIPSIGTNIYGLSDAIIDGETGSLIPVGSAKALEDAILRLSTDAVKRMRMGERALTRVLTHFRQDMLVEALLQYYERILDANKTMMDRKRAGRKTLV
jgi:glycosyltransferase involved in cell wall biosynthesis